jgi:hypothetical protein
LSVDSTTTAMLPPSASLKASFMTACAASIGESAGRRGGGFFCETTARGLIKRNSTPANVTQNARIVIGRRTTNRPSDSNAACTETPRLSARLNIMRGYTDQQPAEPANNAS